MEITRSVDGTRLAYDRFGDGQPIIMVVGAFNTRSTTEPLARALERDFTVFNYDRRGRGDSTDTAPYSVDREIDDIEALIGEAGGSAAVFGYSSGAILALKAAARGLSITKLVLYEPPFQADQNLPGLPTDLADRLTALVAENRRGDAVELFQTEAVGIPREVVAQLRHAPFRPALEAMAQTLVYESKIIGDRMVPTDLAGSVAPPTLVLVGDESPPFLRDGARAMADALPNGRLYTLAGQTHDIHPDATAPVMANFLAGRECPEPSAPAS
jgi:pimeloyl-ACP methyl ester carboxylesterase